MRLLMGVLEVKLSKVLVHLCGSLIILMVIFGFVEPIWLCTYIVATLVLNILGVYQKHIIVDDVPKSLDRNNLLDSSLSKSK